MGLRCLVGHDFGPLLTERDREDRGDEAVVTVREYKECARCGDRRIVSENKEITATGPGSDGSSEFERSESSGSAPEVSSAGQSPEPSTEYEEVSAEEDDGVILPDDDGDDERDPRDWPEHGDEEDAEDDSEDGDYDPWPDVSGEDEGYAAEPSDGGPVEDVTFGSGLAPEPDAGEASGADDGETTTGGGDGESTTPRRDRSPSSTSTGRSTPGARAATMDSTVVCPDCGHTAPAEGSSLRPGDICPECRRGYLVERES